jgi:hypothetical protein
MFARITRAFHLNSSSRIGFDYILLYGVFFQIADPAPSLETLVPIHTTSFPTSLDAISQSSRKAGGCRSGVVDPAPKAPVPSLTPPPLHLFCAICLNPPTHHCPHPPARDSDAHPVPANPDPRRRAVRRSPYVPSSSSSSSGRGVAIRSAPPKPLVLAIPPPSLHFLMPSMS